MTQPPQPQPGRRRRKPGRPGGRPAPADAVRQRRLPVRHGFDRAARPGTLPPPPESASPTSTIAPAGGLRAARYSGPARVVPVRPGCPNPAAGSGRRRRRPRTGARRGRRARHAGPRRAPRSPRRARLQLRHINPWTVFKFACALSIALFFIWLLTVAALYGILDATGVIGRINDAWTTVQGGDTSAADPAQHRPARRDRHRRGQHRAVHRAVDHRLDHLQPVR